MPSLLSSPSLPVRVLAAAVAAALLYYSSHSFRRGSQPTAGAPQPVSDDQASADYVASPNPLRAVGPKPDERWRVIVETMTAEVQAADAAEVRWRLRHLHALCDAELTPPTCNPGCYAQLDTSAWHLPYD